MVSMPLSNELPVVVLKGIVMFPKITAPLMINDARAVQALEAAQQKDRLAFFVAARKDADAQSADNLYGVGTIAKIADFSKMPDGSVRLLIEGKSRAKITRITRTEPYFVAAADPLPEPVEEINERIQARMYSVISQFKEAVNLGAQVPFDVMLMVMNITDPWQLGDLIALNIDFRTDEKQGILESRNAEEKLDKVGAAIARQMKVLQMARKIQSDTGTEIGKMEREMFLREQLKSIEKELGTLGGQSETKNLKDKIEAAGMPDEVKKIADKELARIQGMPSFSPEISYIRTYLDWLAGLPWSKKDAGAIDIRAAKKILDDDHFGLDKVKERILEYLSVQKLTGKIKGPILCFTGPPGTGKTSIGKSIARALGRKFVRLSLGGVRDEAEIRGFRRTYVGALPGRIIQGIATAGTKNPVFMLDEIDKLGSDFRGDPSSALLEALDPEQNGAFSDHYLEVPFDLSDVMFITTANVLETIPPALRDRMEVIEFPGYTEDEKAAIASGHLLPKLVTNHGLKLSDVRITDLSLRGIIRNYTREAGVRNVERELATICRKIARDVAENEKRKRGPIAVGASDLKKYLGPPRFHGLEAEKHDAVGVSTGLAWTEAGGEILLIEATKMAGSGKLILTGHLGQVMQESAQAAFSYARSIAKKMGVKDAFWKDADIHVHVPQGATPKDGPSAGAAIATAIVSVLTGARVHREVGMTGEVTLRGRIMEIGGLKEKVLAAHRAGLSRVLIPKDNEKDLEEVPKKVRSAIRFILVETMDEVLTHALVKKRE